MTDYIPYVRSELDPAEMDRVKRSSCDRENQGLHQASIDSLFMQTSADWLHKPNTIASFRISSWCNIGSKTFSSSKYIYKSAT